MKLDWNEYLNTAEELAAEGCVLLKNDKNTLPFAFGTKVSVFGRIQLHYYKSGTGSGGMVNVDKTIGILDAMINDDSLCVNKKLVEIYKEWEKTHPFDSGTGWGSEPWSQEEMPISDEIVSEAASISEAAVVIIGRTAGEDNDFGAVRGAYYLSETEENLLRSIRKHFSKVVVLLNVGSIINMRFVDDIKPDSVLYCWHGGMNGGAGVVDLLTGRKSPSGKLSDTIAYDIEDYPSNSCWGDDNRNIYKEDIYVGYRYFESFAKEKVQYPFGFGLSYTDFNILFTEHSILEDKIVIGVQVENIGNRSGKEVVQVYAEAPQGKLGKPSRVLAAFKKTPELSPNERCALSFEINFSRIASYDDIGTTGNEACFVLEEGCYRFYIGNDVRSAVEVCSFSLYETKVIEKLEPALTPNIGFERIKPIIKDGILTVSTEKISIHSDVSEQKRTEKMPKDISYTGNRNILLADVYYGKHTMDEFIAQLSDEDLSAIVKGEGMGSPKVTPGTAAAFGGVTETLSCFGIPAGCCDDGPSGLRLDCGTKAFSIPNGTLIACSFNIELAEKLYSMLSLEMTSNKIDNLLGPGMNIHRHPLNGRNFEYFSEDPFLSGTMAAAELRGLHKFGVTGTVKHFCGNNQEKRRFLVESVISERALREIYLRGFEIAVKEGGANSVMTTYGYVNGHYTGNCYDLTTIILREQWGFKGIVMTDWYDTVFDSNQGVQAVDLAKMVEAQNDIYMVCQDVSKGLSFDNILNKLGQGELKRAELQRCASNICAYLLTTHAMERRLGKEIAISVLNKPNSSNEIDLSNVSFETVSECFEKDLTAPKSQKGVNYILTYEMTRKGLYTVSLTGSSEVSALAQIPCTLFLNGIPSASFTFNGTNGKVVTIKKDIFILPHYATMRLYVGSSGVDLTSIKFILKTDWNNIPIEERPSF